MMRMLRLSFASLLIVVVTIGVFAACRNYGLVNLDDYLYLVNYPPVVSWHGWASVKWAFMNVDEAIWMPLTWLSYCLDASLFGTWYGGFHLVSVGIHALNALLVYFLLLELFGRDRGFSCLVGALLWSVHPLRCESVVWLASRKDVLSFFWELLALLFWVRGSKEKSRMLSVTFLSCVCFVMGSMCKPSVMTFPVLCFLLDALVLCRVRFVRYVPTVAYMLFLGPFAAWQQEGGGTVIQLYNDTLLYRVLNACAAFGIYLRNVVWPIDLAPQCMKMWPQMPRFLLPGFVLTGFAAWWALRRVRGYWLNRKSVFAFEYWHGVPIVMNVRQQSDPLFAGALWFVLALVPMLGIASFGFHSFADRFTYIPAVGLSIMLVGASVRIPTLCKAVPLVALIELPALCLLAVRQTAYWKDERTLFTHTLEVDGDANACAHGVLANWYFEFPHDLDKCISEYKKACARDIRHAIPSYNVYLIALVESGRWDEIPAAVRDLENAVCCLFGEERSRELWAKVPGMSGYETMVMNSCFASKVAWWLTDKSGVGAAEEFLSTLCGEALEDRTWQYLQWRLAFLKGDTAAAEKAFARLRDNGRMNTFLRFRYLKNGAGVYDGLRWMASGEQRKKLHTKFL